jgi:hypothetical protein
LPTRSASLPPDLGGRGLSMRMVFGLVLGVVVIAALSPAVAAGLTTYADGAAAASVTVPSRIEIAGNCLVQALTPADGGATQTERVLCGAVAVDVSWVAFSPRSTAAPVMAARRRLVANALNEGLQEDWLETSDGSASPWRVMTSHEPAYSVAVAVWVDGKPVRPGLTMRLRMALNSLAGSAYAPMVVAVTPVVDWETRNGLELRAAQEALPQFLVSHPELAQTVGAVSAIR